MTTRANWRDGLEGIRRDNRSGATALLLRATDLLAAATAGPEEVGSDWHGDFARLAREIADLRPPFAGLLRLADAALRAAEDAETPVAAPERVRDAVRRLARLVVEDGSRVAARAVPLIPDGAAVVTISASSLVERALLSACPGRVVCLESRPAREGVDLAGRLAAAGLRVTLVADAAGARAVAGAAAILLGGDSVTPAGLVHKIGTYGLALAAQRHGVPVYALCGREKWLPGLVRGALADGGPPFELVAEVPPGVVVTNRYFDLTPPDLLAGVVGPDATVPGLDVAARAAQIAVHPLLRDLLEVDHANARWGST